METQSLGSLITEMFLQMDPEHKKIFAECMKEDEEE